MVRDVRSLSFPRCYFKFSYQIIFANTVAFFISFVENNNEQNLFHVAVKAGGLRYNNVSGVTTQTGLALTTEKKLLAQSKTSPWKRYSFTLNTTSPTFSPMTWLC